MHEILEKPLVRTDLLTELEQLLPYTRPIPIRPKVPMEYLHRDDRQVLPSEHGTYLVFLKEVSNHFDSQGDADHAFRSAFRSLDARLPPLWALAHAIVYDNVARDLLFFPRDRHDPLLTGTELRFDPHGVASVLHKFRYTTDDRYHNGYHNENITLSAPAGEFPREALTFKEFVTKYTPVAKMLFLMDEQQLLTLAEKISAGCRYYDERKRELEERCGLLESPSTRTSAPEPSEGQLKSKIFEKANPYSFYWESITEVRDGCFAEDQQRSLRVYLRDETGDGEFVPVLFGGGIDTLPPPSCPANFKYPWYFRLTVEGDTPWGTFAGGRSYPTWVINKP